MLNLNDLAYFVAAVEHGGFAPASRRLGLPKSTLSKRVGALETALDARLVQRTSRTFALTDVGRDFYQHARGALIEAEAAEAIVRRRQAEPSGTVRITASVPVAQLQLARCLPRLAMRHPKLDVQLDVTDRFVDIVQEGVDIAIRSHFAPLADSGLVQRPLAVEPIVLVASPDYLARSAALRTPADLADHDGLPTGPTTTTWSLFDADGQRTQATPRVAMIANESVVLVAAATAGLGIACLPEGVCRDAIARGELLRVLPDWNAGTVTTTLLMPHRRGLLPGVRATVEFLVESFRAPD
ncbi:LysR substrate-binding domain-containing protein [Lysobacter arvi]|uniref:LysR substrate-binding domain-containing protein n=1 Tax=Lysobacter arvi TaxID=3038776 RepID=A0ABU1C9L1_9GAMM|nr:LysR substrate-binding domain-containing protein [Lysobacter arvi]MDR0181878.1 LysR substrate-binding domain-containing protein [Lysobacter arvi]